MSLKNYYKIEIASLLLAKAQTELLINKLNKQLEMIEMRLNWAQCDLSREEEFNPN